MHKKRSLLKMTYKEAKEFTLMCLNSGAPKDSILSISDLDIELVRNDGGNHLDGDVELYIGLTAICFTGAICIMTDGRIGLVGEDEPSELMKPIPEIQNQINWLFNKGFNTKKLKSC